MPWYPGFKHGMMKPSPSPKSSSSLSLRHVSCHAPNLGNADPWGWEGGPFQRAPLAAFPFPSSARSADPLTFPSRASDQGAGGRKHPRKSDTATGLLEKIVMLPTHPACRIPRDGSRSSILLFPEMPDSTSSDHETPPCSTISWIFLLNPPLDYRRGIVVKARNPGKENLSIN